MMAEAPDQPLRRLFQYSGGLLACGLLGWLVAPQPGPPLQRAIGLWQHGGRIQIQLENERDQGD